MNNRHKVIKACFLGVLIIFGSLLIIASGDEREILLDKDFLYNEDDVYFLSTNITHMDQNVLITDANGLVTISSDQSDQLDGDIKLKVQSEDEHPLPNIQIQWRAHNKSIDFIAYDPEENYAPAIYQRNLNSDNNADSNISNEERYKPVSLYELIVLKAFEPYVYDKIFNVCSLDTCEVKNIVDKSKEYIILSCPIRNIPQYFSRNFSNSKATLTLFDNNTFNKTFGLNISRSDSDLTNGDTLINFIINQLNFNDYQVNGTLNANTEILFQINSWESLPKRSIDYNFAILPLGWKGTYSENNSFETAKYIENKNLNGLMISEEDPDFFKFNLEEADYLSIRATFNSKNGDIDLQVYDNNYKLVDSFVKDDSNYKEIMYICPDTGEYYLRVTNKRRNWETNIYNIEIISQKKIMDVAKGVLTYQRKELIVMYNETLWQFINHQDSSIDSTILLEILKQFFKEAINLFDLIKNKQQIDYGIVEISDHNSIFYFYSKDKADISLWSINDL